jgi:hypothetical protein
MYRRIPLELVADPMGSSEHTVGTTALECSYAWLLNHVTDGDHYQRENPRLQTLTNCLQGLVAVF